MNGSHAPSPPRTGDFRKDPAAYARQGDFFDDAWYLGQVPGAGTADAAFMHYLQWGIAQGHAPNSHGARPPVGLDVATIESSGIFDAGYYLANNPDVAGSGMDPLRHFCRHGWKELRNPTPDFDVWWYWCRYMDPARDLMHPGAITVLADSCCGLAVGAALETHLTYATLDLRMD